jgi:hypothetical protein
MYVDGNLLFAIYFIAVLALAVSAYALWSLEEIRQYYSKKNDRKSTTPPRSAQPGKKHSTAAGYYDKYISK